MHKNITRAFAALAASAAAGALGVAGAGTPGASAQAVGPSRAAAAEAHHAPVTGSQLWVARYNGPVNGYDNASSLVVSPSGGRVFVTGSSQGADRTSGFLTIAYDSLTGAQLWTTHYPGPAGGVAAATSMAASPTGAAVFVTGYSIDSGGTGSAVTIAYDPATGTQRWISRSSGSGQGTLPSSMTVSPAGATVFVTGSSDGPNGLDYATIAYNAATGARLWISRYNGPASGDDGASSVATGPGGKKVFVTGYSTGRNGSPAYATVAYEAATGAQLWATRYGNSTSEDSATTAVVSPSGRRVFVTGNSYRGGQYDYATVAYNADTGARAWARRYNGPGNGDDVPSAMAIAPDGGKLFVTGRSARAPDAADYATVAYDTTTGAQVWVGRQHDGLPQSVAVNRTGRAVFVTGQVYGDVQVLRRNYGTVAYRAATGERLWTARYDGPAHQDDEAAAIAVSPTGGRVFITGYSRGTGTRTDYATIAYQG